MRLHSLLCVYIFSLLLCNIVLANDEQYSVVISKSTQALQIMSGNRLVKQFRIAYGKGGKGTKSVVGDNKTPLGTYKITQVKPSDRFHYFMQLNYPNLGDIWYGYKNGIIDAIEFKRLTTAIKKQQNRPPQNTKLGGYIGIHGLGSLTKQRLEIHNATNWTEGCIAMTNEELNYLKQYVGVGTTVVIKQ